MIADCYRGMYDYNKSIVYFKRQLSIAEKIEHPALEAEALHGLGYNHRRMGEYEKSMEYLEQGLGHLNELGYILIDQGDFYSCMGVVLLAQDGREKEAIEILQKANAILEKCNHSESLSLACIMQAR